MNDPAANRRGVTVVAGNGGHASVYHGERSHRVEVWRDGKRAGRVDTRRVRTAERGVALAYELLTFWGFR